MKASRLLAMAAVGSVLGTVAIAQPARWQALDRLEGELHLTPSQEAAWGTFAQSYTSDPQEIAKQQQAEASMSTLTGPQRVDLSINSAKENLAALQRRGDSLKAFYATLSPDQQRTFDRDTLPLGPNR